MTNDPLVLHRETIALEDGREMYLYTFEEGGQPLPEMQAKDVIATVAREDQGL
jgi:hypothetical protein